MAVAAIRDASLQRAPEIDASGEIEQRVAEQSPTPGLVARRVLETLELLEFRRRPIPRDAANEGNRRSFPGIVEVNRVSAHGQHLQRRLRFDDGRHRMSPVFMPLRAEHLIGANLREQAQAGFDPPIGAGQIVDAVEVSQQRAVGNVEDLALLLKSQRRIQVGSKPGDVVELAGKLQLFQAGAGEQKDIRRR